MHETTVERMKLTLVDLAFTAQDGSTAHNKVYNYTKTLCHFASLMVEFRDAWADGDGDRVVRCWKIFLPHFVQDGRRKYGLKALRLQFQVNAVLSPNLAHQVALSTRREGLAATSPAICIMNM